nr:hypothetical protein CFP56_46630 [Quercus suber]
MERTRNKGRGAEERACYRGREQEQEQEQEAQREVLQGRGIEEEEKKASRAGPEKGRGSRTSHRGRISLKTCMDAQEPKEPKRRGAANRASPRRWRHEANEDDDDDGGGGESVGIKDVSSSSLICVYGV